MDVHWAELKKRNPLISELPYLRMTATGSSGPGNGKGSGMGDGWGNGLGTGPGSGNGMGGGSGTGGTGSGTGSGSGMGSGIGGGIGSGRIELVGWRVVFMVVAMSFKIPILTEN